MPVHLHQFTRIGTFHENHCEDYAVAAEIGEGRLLLAVMDGCTMGTESYFASTLIGKLVHKIARQEDYRSHFSQDKIPPSKLLRSVIEQLFTSLQRLSSELVLDKYELLSTLVIALVDTQDRSAVVQVIGDGVVFHNETSTFFDQNNAPDYLSYHLRSNFARWYESQEQLLILKDVSRLVISTDGIFTFAPYTVDFYPDLVEKDLLAFLLLDDADLSNERMFWKKFAYLEETHGLKPTDDIGIVRLDWYST